MEKKAKNALKAIAKIPAIIESAPPPLKMRERENIFEKIHTRYKEISTTLPPEKSITQSCDILYIILPHNNREKWLDFSSIYFFSRDKSIHSKR